MKPTPPAPGALNTNPAGLPSALVPPELAPVPPPPKPVFELTTLKLLLGKGLITQEEFDTAVKDMGGGGTSPTVTVAGWKTTVYGYAELNAIWDSTQSFSESPGNGAVARPTTYAGTHPRFQASVRDSRLGFRVAAPAIGDVKISGNLELDLLGGAGVGAIGTPGAVSEGAFFANPVIRLRHAWGKVETPIVDVLFGQTWGLFGGLPFSTPMTGQIPGLTGGIFNRNTQLRVSKTFKTEYVNVDLAVAGLRPVQRDSALPEGQALARISFPKWTGWHSTYINGTGLQPAWVAVSGTVRGLAVGAPCSFAAPATTCTSTTTNFVTGTGIAVDGFIPIVPASRDDKSNSLALIGQFVSGASINDLFSGLSGGVGAYAGTMTAGTTANGPALDNGLVIYDRDNKLVQPWWISSLVGLEYYLPGGRFALYVNWAHSQLNNVSAIPAAAGIRNHQNLYSGGLMADVTSSVRLGLEYARIVDVYQDGTEASNNAVHGTAFFFF
jgi:hypothetical protein